MEQNFTTEDSVDPIRLVPAENQQTTQYSEAEQKLITLGKTLEPVVAVFENYQERKKKDSSAHKKDAVEVFLKAMNVLKEIKSTDELRYYSLYIRLLLQYISNTDIT